MHPVDCQWAQVWLFEYCSHEFIAEVFLVIEVAQVVASPHHYARETANITDPVQKAVDGSLILDTVQGGTNL